MIESGSHTPGVSAADFGLPAGTAIRWERPDSRVAPFFPAYAVLDSDYAIYGPGNSWMLPSWAMIWIVLTDEPIGVTIGNRRYLRLGSANLYGVTSVAMPVTSRGGVTIAAEVSPLAWARYVSTPADRLRDRITPLGEVWPPEQVDELIAALHRSDRDLAVKGVLDAFFLDHRPSATPHEELIARFWALIADPTVLDPAIAAERLGVSQRALLALSKRYFGFPPKLLLMRARFRRVLEAMLLADDSGVLGEVAEGYHDASHVIRDANRFLGVTPRRFLATDPRYLRAAIRARRLVIGDDGH